MNLQSLALTLTGVLSLTFAHSAAAAGNESAYCLTGTLIVGSKPASDEEQFANILAGCRPGDIIHLPGYLDWGVAVACDFDKQIVVFQDGVGVNQHRTMCVLAKPRPKRE